MIDMETSFATKLLLHSPYGLTDWKQSSMLSLLQLSLCFKSETDQNIILIRSHEATLPECIGGRKKNHM